MIGSTYDVSEDSKKKTVKELVYRSYAVRGEDERRHRIPDYSFAGFYAAARPLPKEEDVPNVVCVEPDTSATSNDWSRIQHAIDSVAKQDPDETGYRGAVLIRAGTYRIEKSLVVRASGVVLRGEGQRNSGGTTLIATNRSKHALIIVGSSDSKLDRYRRFNTVGDPVPIASSVVPVGACRLDVENVTPFAIGQTIAVTRTPNDRWIETLGMGTYGWKADEYAVDHVRRVVDVVRSEKVGTRGTLVLDENLFDSIDQRFGGGSVRVLKDDQGRVQRSGIEGLRLVSEFDDEDDEAHGWVAVRMCSVKNCWTRNVTAYYFGYSCVHVCGTSTQVTVQDCAHLTPKYVVAVVVVVFFSRPFDVRSLTFARARALQIAVRGRSTLLLRGRSSFVAHSLPTMPVSRRSTFVRYGSTSSRSDRLA